MIPHDFIFSSTVQSTMYAGCTSFHGINFQSKTKYRDLK